MLLKFNSWNKLNTISHNSKTMIRGNFLGAAIIAIIYTIYILWNPDSAKSKIAFVIILVILNALTIVLLYFAFK